MTPATFAASRGLTEHTGRARIMVNGRSISLGYFDTREDAHAEYERAKLVYHPAYASGVGTAA